MRRYVLVTAAFMSVLALSCSAWGLGTEDFGNKPLAEANYKEWEGIVPVVNDKARVYSNWVNGNEHFYYTGKAKELNAALENFAKVEVKNHVVVLRPGPATQRSFQGTVIPYDWQLHVVGGIARTRATDDVDDLDWQKDPVLTIYLGDELTLKSLKFPEAVRLALRKEDKNPQDLVEYVAKWNKPKD